MKTQRYFLLIQFFLIVMTFYCCGDAKVSDLNEAETPEYTREHLGQVQFNRWPDDYILLSTVIQKSGDQCKFVQPVKDDPSHYIGPVQSAWVIHSDVKDSDAKELVGLFYGGDRLTLSDLPEGSAKPLSFRPLTTFHKNRLKVEELSAPGAKVLELRVTVKTSKVVVETGEEIATDGEMAALIQAQPELQDGKCRLVTTYCLEGQVCNDNQTAEFSNLQVNLTSSLIPKVQSVYIN